MVYRIVWSNEAEITFLGILDFISHKWSVSEASNFINRTEELVELISKQPLIFKEYKSNHFIRHGILHKNTTLFYKIIEEDKSILLMLFWNNRKKPESLKLS